MDNLLLSEEQSLTQHARVVAKQRMSDWFRQDPTRQKRFTLQACGLTLDYSHNLVTQETLAALSQLCDEKYISDQLQAMVSGETVNHTEHRPALHTALRDPRPNPIMLNGSNIKQAIKTARFACQSLIAKLSEQSITDIVHIGMGGSYWGPLTVYQSLSHLPSKYRVHFVSTIDPAEIESILSTLKPKSTRFILASKSFGTHEMLVNANHAKQWLQSHGIKHPHKHFIAVTENQDAAQSWGVAPDYILPVWEWVGGRFSVWSMISLPVILAYGLDAFDQLLYGAHEMDEHLLAAPWQHNMPVLLAMIDYWYRQYFDLTTLAIIPYEYNLRSLVPHLQQLHMESLGKPSQSHTGGIVWGALGSHAQHTFNQLLQQGTEVVPIDFILSHDGCEKTPDLKQQCFAQRTSLMTGHDALASHAVLHGNRPSNLIMLDSLSPFCLGSLLALYEHKVSVLALLYGVNAFDQFGVEYSKILAKSL